MKPRVSMFPPAVRDLAAFVKLRREALGLPRMKYPPEVAYFTLNGA